jgi:hypothetical protein
MTTLVVGNTWSLPDYNRTLTGNKLDLFLAGDGHAVL